MSKGEQYAGVESSLFSASTRWNNQFNQGCALNCYLPMPFRKRAVVELINESKEQHSQYFYIDYETLEEMPGSEDYFNQDWRMQDNNFLRNGSSIYEYNTKGYQTSYVFHIENPVRFQKEIKVTIEHGHANHLANEMSSVAYWYINEPCKVAEPPILEKRMPVRRDNLGNWIYEKKNQITPHMVKPTHEMLQRKQKQK